MQVAIEHAMTVIGWHENLPKEEVPPEHLWEDTAGLEAWWASVDDKRDAAYGVEAPSSDSDPDMHENDLARFLKS